MSELGCGLGPGQGMAADLDDVPGTRMWNDILYFLSHFSFMLPCSTSIEPCSVSPQLPSFVTLGTELQGCLLLRSKVTKSFLMDGVT